MTVSFHRFFLAVCQLGFALPLLAQIPQQTRPTNPNATPPPGAAGFNRNRPGAAGQPANAAGAGGAERPAIKPEEAIKPSGGVELQFPNTPLSQILLVYEDLTGLKIIKDAAIEQVTVSIETTGELTKERAIMFIEKSLLLNGYSFVPAGEGMVKILGEGKKPMSDGAPLIESASELPETDQVVSFVAILRYLTPDDAVKAIDQIIPRHSYGILTPVPNAKALVIVENSNTIRSILALLERLDVKPGMTVTKRVQLVRSDAEDVKKALDEILGLDEKEGAAGAPGARATIPPVQQQAGQPGTVPQLAVLPTDPSGSTAAEVKPKILAIARTNRLLVIAMPETAEYIETLITELDAASELRTFVSRTLNYLSVESAMGIIGDAIARTEGEESGSGGGGVNSLGQPNSSSNNNRNNTGTSGTGTGTGSSGLFGNSGNNGSGGFGSSSSGFGSNSGGGFGNSGGGGFGGGGGFSGSGGGGNLQPLRVNNGPRSMVIGKTLLISDPTANSLFASGPPEHLRALNEILDELDRRPQQILISAVIAEMQLGEGRNLGIRTLFRGPGERGSIAGGVGGGFQESFPIFDPRTIVPLVGTGTAAGLAGGSGLALYGAIGNSVDIIINALEADSKAKIISRPTIFTLNNTPAAISTGTSFPIASSSQNLGTAGGLISNVQYQDVALSLNIVPLINTPDELTLQISQENSELGQDRPIGSDFYPELSKQLLSTVVMCKNNSTVLLGGLIRDSGRGTGSRVPFLSKIPVLNLLTRSTIKTEDRRELLIFIQPRIVEGTHDLPPTAQDGPGTSPFATEAMAFMQDEKRLAAEADKAAMTPVRRSRIQQLARKLFGRDREPGMEYRSPPAAIQAPR